MPRSSTGRKRRTQPTPDGLLFHRVTHPARGRTVTRWTATYRGVLVAEWAAIGGGWVDGTPTRWPMLAEWRAAVRTLARARP